MFLPVSVVEISMQAWKKAVGSLVERGGKTGSRGKSSKRLAQRGRGEKNRYLPLRKVNPKCPWNGVQKGKKKGEGNEKRKSSPGRKDSTPSEKEKVIRTKESGKNRQNARQRPGMSGKASQGRGEPGRAPTTRSRTKKKGCYERVKPVPRTL